MQALSDLHIPGASSTQAAETLKGNKPRLCHLSKGPEIPLCFFSFYSSMGWRWGLQDAKTVLVQESFKDFPGGPVIKTSNAGDAGSIHGRGAKIPHAS